MYKNKNNLGAFYVDCKYETLVSESEEKIEGLNYNHGDVFQLNDKSLNEKATNYT